MQQGSPLVKEPNRYLRVFLIALGTAAVIFLPFVLIDQGYFIYYGDFNVQQIPFYQMTHDAIREGNIFWSPTTDLGANFIGSYSFYNLGSPFFWLTLPFPSEVVPYLMAPLLALKTAVAALTSYAYIARFVRNKDYAVIGALLYAFSGFTTYNVFFNHFHEAIAFFPLLLIGLEEFMQNGKRGVFCLAVFLNCFVNYFFFAGEVIFVILYWFLRLPSKDWSINLKKFFWLLFEAVLGVALSAVLLLPSVLVVLSNPRTDQHFTGFSALFYGWVQRYGLIIESFFFPPDIPARPNFFPESEAKWGSVAAWLPLFSMCGVFTFMSYHRGHWLKRILGTLFIMALVPLFNSAFFLFNSSYYARWFYMLVLMMALATAISMEQNLKNYSTGIKITAGFTAAIALLIGFLPASVEKGEEQTYGLMKYPDRFWVYVAIAVVSLVLLGLIVHGFRKNPKRFCRTATATVVAISVIYSVYLLSLGKTNLADSRDFIIPYSLNGGEDITIPREDNYRIDVLDGKNLGMDNQAMFWQIPTIQAFHSIVPASIMEFYPEVGVTRDVGSRPEKRYYDLRCFLSVKYLFNRQEMGPDDEDYYHYDLRNQENGYYVYENRNYIPMGFTYDSYITWEEFTNRSDAAQQRLLLATMVLEEDGVARNQDILARYNASSPLSMSDAGLEAYCAARAKTTCKTFDYDNRGFTATINLDKENLVFFSVPWEEGWTASVNGKPVQIEKANIGFMAVRCPAGENITIRFDYMTPGLIPGLAVTGGAVVVFLLYFFGMGVLDRRKRRRLLELEGEETDDYLSDLPVNGEGADGIQYDYYLKDVSIVFPEIEEGSAKEPPSDSASYPEEELVDLTTQAEESLSPDEEPENRNEALPEKGAPSEASADVDSATPQEEKEDPSDKEGA